jgi:nickel superoxide dismutase
MFNIPIVKAHCDIPCKIYDPAVAQYGTLSIIRFIDLINEIGDSNLSPAKIAQLSRLTSQKEDHARDVKNEITTIWGDYFKKPQIEKFPEIHELVHLIMQDASKCKQELIRENAENLLQNINKFTQIFWTTKQIETKSFISPYPPELEIICPILKDA